MSHTSQSSSSDNNASSLHTGSPPASGGVGDYILIVKNGGPSRRFTVRAASEGTDLAKIKEFAGDHPVSCELCRQEQMQGRICLFKGVGNAAAGARRWPGSQHVCPRFRGEPTTAFRELVAKDIDVAKLCGTTKGAATFRLVLTDPLAARRTKATREKVVGGYAARVASRIGATPLPSRSLGGALVVLMEEAGFNVSNASSRRFLNGFGMLAVLQQAATKTPAWVRSMRHPVLFLEALGSAGNLSEKIDQSLQDWTATRKKPNRVFLVGRLKRPTPDPSNPDNIMFQLNGMVSDWIHMDQKLWNHWGPPKDKAPWFAHGSLTELVCICRVQASGGMIRASDVAFVPVDDYGMPFPESRFEPKCARILREMRVPFAKPCHALLSLGGNQRVWPDFVLSEKDGTTLVIEVDPGGFSKKPAKFLKQIRYTTYEIVVISWDPLRHDYPLVDWSNFSRLGDLF
ncbi:hypothetical protein [Oleiharenicola lentus]|uniref:hypothetical protein n=1 Tax=Oleiharenicola lentus TaxID=2508720 RepID=UPI003F67E2A2